jgi:hypothetical protein
MEFQQGFGISGMRQIDLFAARQFLAAHVRYGSKASFWALWPDVRFTPQSDRDSDWFGGRSGLPNVRFAYERHMC